MELSLLEKLIEEISSEKGLSNSELIEDLTDFLKIKYGISIMEKERDLIDEVKNKVITKLYNSENHFIGSKFDLSKSFKLDLLEIDYLSSAIEELTHEGLVSEKNSEITLTKEGVMKFKEFYGEI